MVGAIKTFGNVHIQNILALGLNIKEYIFDGILASLSRSELV